MESFKKLFSSMFEAAYGPAFGIAGKDVDNPIRPICLAATTFHDFGETDATNQVQQAISMKLRSGLGISDLGGPSVAKVGVSVAAAI